MAKYGSNSVAIQIKDGVDGAGDYQTVSTDILNLPGLEIEAVSEESHGFGVGWAEHLATGLKQCADITLKGFYDDTASTGTHALFKRAGSIATMKITWGGSYTSEFDVLIQKYRRLPARGALTKFEASLQVTGEVVEAP